MEKKSLRVYEDIKERIKGELEQEQAGNRPVICITMSTCAKAAGAEETRRAIEETLAERGIDAHVVDVGCLGHCYAEPLIIVSNPALGFPPICYHGVNASKGKLIVRSYLEDGDPSFEYILGAMEENDLIPPVTTFPRFSLEQRVVMEYCGFISPWDIREYIEKGGYEALARALETDPSRIIEEIEKSGLRGRGGAGFPTGRKWRLARNQPSNGKIVICNADEGDPGAYMDRTIIESNPHQLLEGLIICAYAVGASEAIVYVRAEYPLAVKTVRHAIEEARKYGFVGENILGSGFSLDVRVFQGSGAFVCGEETALIQSLEGRRGMPRHRPPYPVEKGLWGLPTVVNNVKTLASVPAILSKGAEWFRSIGTESSPGTAIFSVVGNVKHAGLVEIAMGTTLRELIFEVCGGIPGKKKFKAVQIGGPSGGCLPEEFLDTPIDFDSLTRAGAMMGSGGMVVMDEDSCMVDVARYFLEFTQKESCGKCTFCRIGTKHMLDILDRITKGEGSGNDLELLERLAHEVKAGSLCGLGKTAPNPVITSLKYFMDEYRAHVEEKRCPALKCRALIAYYIDLDKCARGCEACVGSCPVEAIFTTKGRKKAIDQSLCVKCGECMVACPPEYDAVRKVSPPELAPVIERPPDQQPKKKTA
ncbi:NADH-quinone oxidoreductase subunit NuoF [Thermodesulforhabdus norvegica]|uniref:NADH-quinone oxidoreductase subunit F n=1 Tax=Thermodesulforhabdus norvegica TaxID=39841 RepID=A0A1I4SM93_9BACT|nr:NADH-quinone oxidoreductase subunit NuoF [Thermodesulforhabdus norvegica]SFM65470.1 NADH-quinone oxidoreductase subunit F [Thermodesulforhabdus norvegica]